MTEPLYVYSKNISNKPKTTFNKENAYYDIKEEENLKELTNDYNMYLMESKKERIFNR